VVGKQTLGLLSARIKSLFQDLCVSTDIIRVRFSFRKDRTLNNSSARKRFPDFYARTKVKDAEIITAVQHFVSCRFKSHFNQSYSSQTYISFGSLSLTSADSFTTDEVSCIALYSQISCILSKLFSFPYL